MEAEHPQQNQAGPRNRVSKNPTESVLGGPLLEARLLTLEKLASKPKDHTNGKAKSITKKTGSKKHRF